MEPKPGPNALELRYLEDLWDDRIAAELDEVELLRYRSNLLGRDLRITNFGGGNTSSKIGQADPLDGSRRQVLYVKGSGGDLGSIRRGGFAELYLEKLRALEARYRGVEYEDEIVDYYPLCGFGPAGVAASIDTPLHGLLPFAHVDHLHPDWGIALAAAANGRQRMEEFNQRFDHQLVWVPWQRPGFELALMMRRAIEAEPRCDGIVLGGHGLFTWGETQRECYRNSITVIDQLGRFVLECVERTAGELFGGELHRTRPDARELALELLPFLRGRVSGARRVIGSFCDLPEVLRFVNSRDAAPLARLGTSCPDHFIRTKIRPLFVSWDPQTDDGARLQRLLDETLAAYRREYEEYYRAHATADSPAMRDPNPSVVLVPGVGMFSFGKSKAEARITGEFYVNAIHVMEGATALGPARMPGQTAGVELPQAGAAAPSDAFKTCNNYVALPLSEAFRIEYWKLEDLKLRRQPPEKEFSRRVMMVVGAGHGIGRETALLAARRGAHLVLTDLDMEACRAVAAEIQASAGPESTVAAPIDIRDRASVRETVRQAVGAFAGLDVLVITAALFPSSADGHVSDEQWRRALEVNILGNHLVVDEVRRVLAEQGLPAAIVLTSSANAVVPKAGSEAYDISKAAVSHLVRELAISLAPDVRVCGIAPATVVEGSTMFPRERVLASLAKYGIAHDPAESTEELRSRLAAFYAQRTLTRQAIRPADCAEAILFLAGDRARCTTGHVFPVDGGLVEAFLR